MQYLDDNYGEKGSLHPTTPSSLEIIDKCIKFKK